LATAAQVAEDGIRIGASAVRARRLSIVDHVTKALRNAGIPNSEIDKFCDEVLASEESELRQICVQWVTLVP
jgi:hypothetical protein